MEPGETPHPHRGAPCTYSHVKTFKTLSSVTFVQSRAPSRDAGGGERMGEGGGPAGLLANEPKMCSICPNLTPVSGVWRASAPPKGNEKLKVLTEAATAGCVCACLVACVYVVVVGGGHSHERETVFTVLDCFHSRRKATDAADSTSQDGAGVSGVSPSGWHCRRRLWNRIDSPDAESSPTLVSDVSHRWWRWLTTDVLWSCSDAARAGLRRYPNVEYTQTIGRDK